MKTTWMERIIVGSCLLFLAGGVWLRFVHLGDQIYHNDEAWTGLWRSGHSVRDIRNDLCGRVSQASEWHNYLRLTPGRGLAATISAVASDDPKQGPVYFGLLRLWVGLVGDSSAARRTLSVLFGLMLCPLAFWLARQLFSSQLPGWISAALIAVSPAQILYSQDIRPYSMLAAAVLLSSSALLRAVRRKDPTTWSAYGATVIAGLYVHPLFILVMISHAAYVILPCFMCGRADSTWQTMLVRPFVGTILIAGLVFSPWIIVFALGWKSGLGGMAWLLHRIPFRYLAESWITACGRIFVDFTAAATAWPKTLLYSIITVLVILSFAQLWKTQPWRGAALSLLLFLVPFLVLVPADLLLGGQSSTVDRYFIAAYLAAQLSLAFGLATAISSPKPLVCGLGAVLFVGILAGGAYSAWLNSRTDAPWIKGPAREHRRMADVIKAETPALLVCDCKTIIRLLAFSPFLPRNVEVAVLQRTDRLANELEEDRLQNFRSVFLFRGPVGSEFDGRLPVEPVPGASQLWRLQRRVQR